MNGLLLEPLKYYATVAKEKHRALVAEYFDELVKQSRMNVAENHKTVEAYRKKQQAIANLIAQRNKYKGWRTALIVLSVLCGVLLLLVFANVWEMEMGPRVLLGLFAVAVAVVAIVVCVRKLNPLIRNVEAEQAKREREASEILALAEAQMAALNALFDNTDIHRLIEKTMPQVSFHTSLSPAHITLLRKENDYRELFGDCNSVVDTQAGTLCENPFLFVRYLTHSERMQTYYGSLVIRWTETRRDSEGRLHRVSRSQTLTASVQRPVPHYDQSTCLLYGSQVAPDLSFRRSPSHAEDLSERALERKISAGEKDLQEFARESIQRGGAFQEMANTEFEVLFGAENRDNEVQFRVMYTPLAQQNTVALLLDDEVGYGDEFYFTKRCRTNMIYSEHAQSWQMNTSPTHYRSYDVEDAREKFMRLNTEYFKSVFFDFAPLLAVPGYQDPPMCSMEEMPEQASNSTPYEYEVLANAIGWRCFASKHSTNGATLKAEFVSRNGDTDRVAVTAYSYRAEDRVEYVMMLGGDGYYHEVPVPWVEYVPLERTRTMMVRKMDLSEREFLESKTQMPENAVYCHGLLAYPIS